jgi:hypothetical protein
LQRKSGKTVNTPVDTASDNSEINSSDSLPSNKNQDDTEKQADNYLSALSGSSPVGSSIEGAHSEDLKYSWKYSSSGDKSCNPFDQEATPSHLAEDNKKSPGSIISTDSKYSSKSASPFDQESTPRHPGEVLPPKPTTYTDLKMTNFDPDLEHIVTKILKFTLIHTTTLALSQSYIQTFDDFQTIDVDDVHEFTLTTSTDPNAPADTKLHK